MIISLIGYMGSGKSQIAKTLSEKINFKLIDLDFEISKHTQLNIQKIFELKGEIYFRKVEKELLELHLSSKENCILSLGGGTPAYYDNIHKITSQSTTIYLRTSIKTLADRLSKEKNNRPLIVHLNNEDLPEYIAKHLFERSAFYNKADIIIDTDGKSPNEIAEEIIKTTINNQK